MEYLSVDTFHSDEGCLELPTETFNSITPSGLPPHRLLLKPGCIVILLRNLDVPKGLCNGTRLKVRDTGKKVG